MQQAHIIRQQAYLDALGIACHVSRRDLPGAAPSQRQVVQVAAPVAHGSLAGQRAEPAVPASGDVAARLRPGAPSAIPEAITEAFKDKPDTGRRQPDPVDSQPEPRPAPASPVVRFTLCAAVAGHWLWLEALPRAVLARDQVQLIQAMAQALGAPGAPQVAQFDWPPHNNHQLDLGEAAARAALHSFLERQVAERGCRALIVLGEGALAHLGEARPAGADCVIAPASTADMLADPTLKPRVWEAIRPLRRVTPAQ
ncbi:hypothetical protein [Parahaliea mediterranea]|uniref:hypothetical protein n=1 Tax=Parahaliea mediterranea TaxID=651086 RepID=UPI001300B06C|nr:hypothetical protein [Parahaliea mediterranea]